VGGVPYLRRDMRKNQEVRWVTLVTLEACSAMITANVIKAVHDVLRERGIEQRPNERLGDYVARGLGVSDAKAEAFLEYVHDGASADEAKQKAGIETEGAENALLVEVARVIGSALGRIAR
jgi:hypothetical protein